MKLSWARGYEVIRIRWMPRHNGGANETTLKGPSSEHYLVRHGEAIAKLSLILVMVAAFGPYTPLYGVRTEQVAVYGCLLLTLAMTWARIRITRNGGLFLSVWGISAAPG